MADSEQKLTPVGRLVQGHPMIGSDTDMNGRPKTTLQGQPKTDYFCAIAVDKNDPAWGDFWGWAYAIGAAAWPAGQYQQAGFAWKVTDGDAVENAAKPGFAGCWVIKMTSGFAPRCVRNVSGAYQEITNPEELKRGYYLRALVAVKGNGNAQKPGVYMNPVMLEFVGYGEEIQTGPDASQVFGGAQVGYTPAGMSAAPLATAQPAAPAPGVAAPVAAPVAPAPAVAAPVPPAQAAPAAAIAPPMAAPVAPSAAVAAPVAPAAPSAAGAHGAILSPPAPPA